MVITRNSENLIPYIFDPPHGRPTKWLIKVKTSHTLYGIPFLIIRLVIGFIFVGLTFKLNHILANCIFANFTELLVVRLEILER